MGKLAINGGNKARTKPFPSWPVFDKNDIEAVAKVLESGTWGYAAWTQVPKFEAIFAAYQDARYGICFNSGTSALTAALWAVGVKPGDEVILPAFTFIATATSVVQLGAIPVFADIEAESLNIDPVSVGSLITEKTSAVVPVHIGGCPADMTKLAAICKENDLKLVEDAAQAWGSEWQNHRVGALGDAGIFSFQSSKNVNSGEGGIVVTNDEEVAELARSYCNCGRLEDKPRYEHFFIGGNYRMTEMQAALLLTQFERYPEQMELRNENAEYLESQLAMMPGIISINAAEEVTARSLHLFLMRYMKKQYNEEISKFRLIEALNAEGIPAAPGYTVPIYRQPVFLSGNFGPAGFKSPGYPDYSKVFLPETENAAREEVIWMTQNVLLGDLSDVQDIINAFEKVFENSAELL